MTDLIAITRLKTAADAMELELSRQDQSHPLLFKRRRELIQELQCYLNKKQASGTSGVSSASAKTFENTWLVNECWVMIVTATLLLSA